MSGTPEPTVSHRGEHKHDVREALWELAEDGDIEVLEVPEPYREVERKDGRTKKIPLEGTWHHKSCGQCGHIPGYSTSIFWLHRELGYDYYDPKDQTSCTGWNFYASATSNEAAQAGVALRNFGQAKADGYYPLIHCGTSFGHYKEVREQVVTHDEVREEAEAVLDRLGHDLVMPEEIVHYSEWTHAVREEIANNLEYDLSNITATVHPACHYHKILEDDAIYDPEIYGGERIATVTALLEEIGVDVADYSTWYDCCGFGFRHILVERDFSRSFATQRKIERMQAEADPDVTITHDTGCVTTLDSSQWVTGEVHDRDVGIPVMSEAQFAALAMGAHPYKVCQLHWHKTDYEPLLEKMGIDHEAAWAEFEAEVDAIENGDKEYITWNDV